MNTKTISSILLHPYFRILMIALIVLSLLNSCEYGPQHGHSKPSEVQEKPSQPTAKEDPNNLGEKRITSEEPDLPVPSKEFTERDLVFEGRTVALTHHARCRMDCRKIDAFEIQEVIDQKKINYKKTKPAQPGKCPTIAYEGMTRDRQHVRVIVGDCQDDPIIITVIDLGNKYQCSCN